MSDLLPDMVGQWWACTRKADRRCRLMADRHYTRQTPGALMFTRPGYNYVLFADGNDWKASWVWWRPKWESGIKGTERKDGLRAIECTLFRMERNSESVAPLASELIVDAVSALSRKQAERELRLSCAGDVRLITAVGVSQTAKRRGKRSEPGQCYVKAGWKRFDHPSKDKSKVWLELPGFSAQESGLMSEGRLL